MTILTVDELLTIVPSLATYSEEELSLAINSCIFAIQSPDGANRNLEITDYSEVKKLRLVYRQISLSYFPVIEISKIYIRGEVPSSFNRFLNSIEWAEIDNEFYRLESNGIITLNIATPVRNQSYQRPIEIKVEYSAGYDFSESTQDTTLIKSLICKSIQYQLTNTENIKAISVEGEYSTTYGGGEIAQFGIPKSYLAPFKKYAPRKTNG